MPAEKLKGEALAHLGPEYDVKLPGRNRDGAPISSPHLGHSEPRLPVFVGRCAKKKKEKNKKERKLAHLLKSRGAGGCLHGLHHGVLLLLGHGACGAGGFHA